MDTNIVTRILKLHFNGSYQAMANLFGVTAQAVRKWESAGEFPAKNGRTQQAHELTQLDYKVLTPTAFKSPKDYGTRLKAFHQKH